MTKHTDPLIGRAVRLLDDATTRSGDPHPLAGQIGTVTDRTGGGRQYVVQVGERSTPLPLDSFELLQPTVQDADHGASTLALDDLAPSRTNRTVLDDEDLRDMAATIKLYGVLQPLLVRKLPPERLQDTFEDAATRRATHEIIAGERRWRAARIAGLRRVPVLHKDANAPTALTMQLIENLHRTNLNPLDEARGIQRLMQEHGYTREATAEALRKSLTYVFEAQRMLHLHPEAQAALRDGVLKRSLALLVAQRPTAALQQEFLHKVLTNGPDGGAMSYRAAADLARRAYTTDLTRVPFDLHDATLVPEAGACDACPKRTSANPELWDKPGTDVCTDTACFATKRETHFADVAEQARQRGSKVITGDEAREIMPTEGGSPVGYILLDKPRRAGEEPLRTLLGKDVPQAQVVLIQAPSGAMVEAVPTRAAGDALKARGTKGAGIAEGKPPQPAEPTREELQADYQQRWRASALRAVLDSLRAAPADALNTLPPVVAYRVLLPLALDTEDAYLRTIFDLPMGFRDEDIATAVQTSVQAGPTQVHRVMMMLAATIDAEPLFDRPPEEALQLDAAATLLNVDLGAIKSAVQADMKAEAGARAPNATSGPTPKLKRKPRTSQTEAQAAIAQALTHADSPNGFAIGQSVRVRIDLKDAKGHLQLTKGAAGIITAKVGDRAWRLDVPDLPMGTGLVADYTELDAAEQASSDRAHGEELPC